MEFSSTSIGKPCLTGKAANVLCYCSGHFLAQLLGNEDSVAIFTTTRFSVHIELVYIHCSVTCGGQNEFQSVINFCRLAKYYISHTANGKLEYIYLASKYLPKNPNICNPQICTSVYIEDKECRLYLVHQ